MDFSAIDALKAQLDAKRPLPPELVRNLRAVYRVDWTYHSNAIEGNTLSLLETKLVLEEGLTIGGKKLTEHLEAINHAEAIDYVEELAQGRGELTEKTIKDIHYLVLKQIDNQNAGKYRSVNVLISGSRYRPPDFLQVPSEMQRLIEWYASAKSALHPVEAAALLHFHLVRIHPFADGNGRTARLLMNLSLMSDGYPPAIIKADPEHRRAYYDTLELASTGGNTEPFVRLVAECVKESLEVWLRGLGSQAWSD